MSFSTPKPLVCCLLSIYLSIYIYLYILYIIHIIYYTYYIYTYYILYILYIILPSHLHSLDVHPGLLGLPWDSQLHSQESKGPPPGYQKGHSLHGQGPEAKTLRKRLSVYGIYIYIFCIYD